MLRLSSINLVLPSMESVFITSLLKLWNSRIQLFSTLARITVPLEGLLKYRVLCLSRPQKFCFTRWAVGLEKAAEKSPGNAGAACPGGTVKPCSDPILQGGHLWLGRERSLCAAGQGLMRGRGRAGHVGNPCPWGHCLWSQSPGTITGHQDYGPSSLVLSSSGAPTANIMMLRFRTHGPRSILIFAPFSKKVISSSCLEQES